MNFQKIRVPAGFLFAALYLLLCRPTPTAFAAGLLLGAAGLGLRLWAAGHLEKWKGLTVSGPYRFTRNPLYLGSFLMGLGFSIASSRLLLVSLFALLFILIYVPVMRREEQELHGGYGESFETYRLRVPLFLPIRPLSATGVFGSSAANRSFRWDRVVANREYQAVVGFLVVAGLVWLKMVWR